MKNIFKTSVQWSKEVTNQKGLPRPYADATLNKEYKTRFNYQKLFQYLGSQNQHLNLEEH
jgi:hypothetical protein